MPTLKPTSTGPKVYVAGLWRRVTALVIDLIILAPVLGLSGWITVSLSDAPPPFAAGFSPEAVLELFLWGGLGFYVLVASLLFWMFSYFVCFEWLVGATPGAQLLKVQVIDRYGRRPALWRVLVRCAAAVLSTVVFGLGWLWMLVDDQRRNWQDRLSGTFVIRQQRT